jgi:hypothetical protein
VARWWRGRAGQGEARRRAGRGGWGPVAPGGRAARGGAARACAGGPRGVCRRLTAAHGHGRRRRLRSGGGRAKRRQGEAGRAPGGSNGGGARGIGPRAGAGRPGGMRGGAQHVPRRRGSDSTAAAPIRVGNRSGSRRRPRLSSPWVDFGRRRPRRGSSTKRAELSKERQWRPWSAGSIRLGLGATEVGKGWSGFGVRSRGSGREGTRCDGEERPGSTPATHCTAQLRSS